VFLLATHAPIFFMRLFHQTGHFDTCPVTNLPPPANSFWENYLNANFVVGASVDLTMFSGLSVHFTSACPKQSIPQPPGLPDQHFLMVSSIVAGAFPLKMKGLATDKRASSAHPSSFQT
jgi:hypothetical protein